MASTQVVETSVAKKSPFQVFINPDNLSHSRHFVSLSNSYGKTWSASQCCRKMPYYVSSLVKAISHSTETYETFRSRVDDLLIEKEITYRILLVNLYYSITFVFRSYISSSCTFLAIPKSVILQVSLSPTKTLRAARSR